MATFHPIEIDGFWLPKARSTIAAEIDHAWDLVNLNSAVWFAIVIGVMVYCVIKFRRKSDTELTSPLEHSWFLEITWTAVPLVVVMGFFFLGFKGFMHANVAPADAYEIYGTGQKWSWAFTYPNGTTTLNELRVPKGKPVKVILSSKDVLHDFYVPEFRIKQDAVPGSYTTVWFEATETGETTLECAQYCGTGHSDMLARVIIMDEPKFNEWLENGGDDDKKLSPVEKGKKLYASKTCESCHTIDGSPKIGPSFKGIWGKQEELWDGSKVLVDENYVRESILVPTAKEVKGFHPSPMPSFKGLVNDKEIEALIAYIKSLK